MEPFRTAATTMALRRTTHRLVSGEGRSGTAPAASLEAFMWAKESATDMFLISKWLIATGRYPAFFKEALNGPKPWSAIGTEGGRAIINNPRRQRGAKHDRSGTIPALPRPSCTH